MKGSARQYAAHRSRRGEKVSPQAVDKAIRTGRIARGPDGLIDFEAADIAWQARTKSSTAIHPPIRHREQMEPALVSPPQSAVKTGAKIAAKEADRKAPNYFDARSLTESLKAELLALKLAKEQGELLDAKEVKRMAIGLVTNAKSKMIGMANAMAPQVAVESDPVICQSMMFSFVLDVLRELSAWAQ